MLPRVSSDIKLRPHHFLAVLTNIPEGCPMIGGQAVAYWANPQGMRVTCSYDGSQRLQNLQEPAGRLFTLTYNAQNRVQAVQDWGGRFNTLTYSGAGDLTQVQGPTGCLTQYAADASHLPLLLARLESGPGGRFRKEVGRVGLSTRARTRKRLPSAHEPLTPEA